jgi:hypothetical protein
MSFQSVFFNAICGFSYIRQSPKCYWPKLCHQGCVKLINFPTLHKAWNVMDLNCVIKDLLSWQTTIQHCFLHAATGKSLWLSWNLPKYFFTFLLGNRSKLFSPYYIQNSLIKFPIFLTSSFRLLDPHKAPVVHSGYHLLHINFSVYYLSVAPAALTP